MTTMKKQQAPSLLQRSSSSPHQPLPSAPSHHTRHHVREQDVSLSQQENDDGLSPTLSEFKQKVKRQQKEETDSPPPSPIIGPPIDYEYSTSFTDMVKAIVAKNRASISSNDDQPSNQKELLQEQHQHSETFTDVVRAIVANKNNSPSSDNNDTLTHHQHSSTTLKRQHIERGQRAVFKKLEQTSSDDGDDDGLTVAVEQILQQGASRRKQQTIDEVADEIEISSRVEQGRRDSSSLNQQVKALAQGLSPFLDAFDINEEEKQETFQEILVRVAKEYPSSLLSSPVHQHDAATSLSRLEQEDNLIDALLNFDDDNDNESNVEHSRRLTRVNLSQDLFQPTNSMEDSIVLANYSLFDHIHPWLYNTNDNLTPQLSLLLQQEQEQEEEEARNFISRNPTSVNEVQYITQREWFVQQQQDLQHDVRAFDRLSVSPQRSDSPHRNIISGGGRDSVSPFRSGGSNGGGQHSKRLSPLDNKEEKEDDSWGDSDTDFTRLLNWDSRNETFRGSSLFYQKQDYQQATNSKFKDKQRAIEQEDNESYKLYEESEPNSDLLRMERMLDSHKQNYDTTPPSDIEKYIIATSTPNNEFLGEWKRGDVDRVVEKPKISGLLGHSPSRDKDDSTEQQQRKRKIELVETDDSSPSSRLRIQQAPSFNKSHGTDENVTATTSHLDNDGVGATVYRDTATIKEPFEFRRRDATGASVTTSNKEPFEFSKRQKTMNIPKQKNIMVQRSSQVNDYVSSTSSLSERRRRLMVSLDDLNENLDDTQDPSHRQLM